MKGRITESGKKTYKCGKCGDSYEEEILTLGYEYKDCSLKE